MARSPLNAEDLAEIVARHLGARDRARLAAVSRTTRRAVRTVGAAPREMCFNSMLSDTVRTRMVDKHTRASPFRGHAWTAGWSDYPEVSGRLVWAVPGRKRDQYDTKAKLIARLRTVAARAAATPPGHPGYRAPTFQPHPSYVNLLKRLANGTKLLCGGDIRAYHELRWWISAVERLHVPPLPDGRPNYWWLARPGVADALAARADGLGYPVLYAAMALLAIFP